MAKPMTVTTRSDSRKPSTEQARQGKDRPAGVPSAQEDVRFQRGAVISLDQSLVSKWFHNGLRRAAYSITLSARARIGSSLFGMASIERLLADHLQGLTQRFAGNMNRWRCHVNTSGEGAVEIQDELERHGDREGT
jgi:hypothetical protein